MTSIVAVNARNQFQGKISSVIPGPVVSEIWVETPVGLISSVITTSSVKELHLERGVTVLALFKATEVSLAKLQPERAGDPS